MARVPFAKMHGAGNDFVVVAAADLETAGVVLDRGAVFRLCHRRTGVGADGLLIVAADPEADFRMTYFNSDGGEVDMCGNGARCAYAFARERGLAGADAVFRSAAGTHRARAGTGEETVSLTPPTGIALDVDPGIEHPFERIHTADTGVPHLVIPVDDVETVEVRRWGRALREAPAFAPGGVNVNWVQRRDDGAWLIRTYERGVEDETLACGTGASAAGLLLCRLGEAAAPVRLLTRGGDRLTIGVDDPHGAPALELTGPAVTAFQGEIEL